MNSPKLRLLHIGYPKAMSTSLQRDFFAKHKEIEFLGWGRPDTEHGWTDDDMATLCEVGIRYENTLSYNERVAKKVLAKHIRKFEKDITKRLLCLSSESFSFTMHFDVDPTIKAQRLIHLMGGGTKVLIVIRNQFDLFRSYYFECVRGGYPGQFEEFLNFHYHHIFHSILSDLHYGRTYRLYCRLFGKNNVKVLPMEALIADSARELSRLCEYLGVSDVALPLGHYNDSGDKKYLQAVRLLNEKFPNNRGNTYFGWVDGEKLRAYWRTSLRAAEPAESSRNYGTRMMVYRAAEAVVTDFVGPLAATYSEHWKKLLCELYGKDNAALADAIGIDLQSLGYTCA